MRGIHSGNVESARTAAVTTVTFIVAFAPLLCALPQTKEPSTGECSTKKKGAQVVDVNARDTTVTLKCAEADKATVTPKFDAAKFMVCTQEKCATQELLSKYVDGSTAQVVDEATAKVTIRDLPSAEKTFYVRCEGKTDDTCYIQVNVTRDPSKPVVGGSGQSGVVGGLPGSTGGVTSGGSLSCATPGEAITIKILEKGSTAQFTCGENLTLYPRATDRVFAEDCKKEESLKDIVRSAKANVYTLTADKKPPKKKWCYLCASSRVTSLDPGKASDYCVVHVESSSRPQCSSAIALAAMLPSVLAMLHIT